MQNILSSLFTILVLQEFWEVEKFWNKFLDIIGVIHECLPGSRNRMELSISTIKPGGQKTRIRLITPLVKMTWKKKLVLLCS